MSGTEISVQNINISHIYALRNKNYKKNEIFKMSQIFNNVHTRCFKCQNLMLKSNNNHLESYHNQTQILKLKLKAL